MEKKNIHVQKYYYRVIKKDKGTKITANKLYILILYSKEEEWREFKKQQNGKEEVEKLKARKQNGSGECLV